MRARSDLQVLYLTSADEKKALVSATLARKSLSGLSEGYQAQVEELWDKASKKALAHLNLVLQNNPHKPVSEVLARPDVAAVLRVPYEQAAEASEVLLREAWAAAEKEAVRKAKGEFKLLGEGWQGYSVDEDLLSSLVADLHANAKAMRSRYRKALTAKGPSQLPILASDVRNRASFSLSTAVWGVATQVRDSALAKAGLNKMWLSRMDDKTCSHCREMHGTVLPPGKFFVTALKLYREAPLLGPPAHPRCRCVIVATKLPVTKLKKSNKKS